MIIKFRLALVPTLALGALALSGSSNAALLTFTDRASFLAAAGSGLANIDFSGLATNSQYVTLSSSNGAIASGVTFSSTQTDPDALFVGGPGTADGVTSNSLFANYFGSSLIASFAPNVTALGATVFTAGDRSVVSIAVSGPGGPSTYTVSTVPGAAFFGVIGTDGTSIDGVTFSPNNFVAVGVDDFTFGTARIASSVPGPAAALPFALMALRRRKRA